MNLHTKLFILQLFYEFVLLLNEEAKYNFSNNQLLSIACRVQRFYYFVTAIYAHLLFMTRHFRSKQNITRDNNTFIFIERTSLQ